jgi:hypothetical protein
MRYYTSPSFWELYDRLPPEIQKLSDKQFKLLKTHLSHPSLHLKKTGAYWSVRIGIRYRAIGIEIENGLLWFWIGSHSKYDRMIK